MAKHNEDLEHVAFIVADVHRFAAMTFDELMARERASRVGPN